MINNYFLIINIIKKKQEISGLLSFTVDAWTSKNQLPFLGICAHWIDDEWNLQSTTLDFCFLIGSHSGDNLAKRFIDILKDFNFLQKVYKLYINNSIYLNFN